MHVIPFFRSSIHGKFLVKVLLGLMMAAILTPLAIADDTLPATSDTVGENLAAVEGESPAVTAAEEDAVTTSALAGDLDTLWTCLAAFFVFFMQAGFAMVETGFTRAKNACNILMKNLMDFSIGTVIFWVIGFGLMFGVTYKGLIGTDNFIYDAGDNSFNWAFLIFQTVFCATAATIVSGAMAERTKFISYLIYTAAITAIVYPIFGAWAWNSLYSGGGWLEGLGFHDFAGSTVVHSIGGWAALAGAIVIGPRIGKYSGKKINAIPGHNIPLAALGVFILWLGWFGFNPGSTTAVGGGSFAFIAVTTNISAACGSIGAMITAWILFKKPDISLTLNGALAGLVGITAGCDCISVPLSALTGLIAGVLVVFACIIVERMRIDDPVGAISVHGICGAWGTLAVGLFGMESGLVNGGGLGSLGVQALGVGTAFLWSFSVSFTIFMIIKKTIGLRVSEVEEEEGLDLHEHGQHAYPAAFIGLGEAPKSFVGLPVTASSGRPSVETH